MIMIIVWYCDAVGTFANKVRGFIDFFYKWFLRVQ